MFRFLFAVIWMVILFVCTCTFSFQHMISEFDIRFVLRSQFHWLELLILPDQDIIKLKWYLPQKIGHFVGFAILAVILTNFGRNHYGVILAVGYAAITEILQLYFSRDGRLVDVLIDGSGIVLAFMLCKILQKNKGTLT